jgi:hypothetical protein
LSTTSILEADIPEITPVQIDEFHGWISQLAGERAGNIFSWILGGVPQHGFYAGNGTNDAWIVWQSYNYVFGDGSTIDRSEEGANLIQGLFIKYRSNYADDPLRIWPREAADWNAFFHDLGSVGGLTNQILNHLTFAQREITDFLNGADIFHLVSGPFRGLPSPAEDWLLA